MVLQANCCVHYLRQSLLESSETNFCSNISALTSCLVSSLSSMGHPFGTRLTSQVEKAVHRSVHRLCAVRCQLNIVGAGNGTDYSRAVGNRLKVCAFDALISSGFKGRKMCDKLDDLVKCMIVESTGEDFLVILDEIQTGTYVMADILSRVFHVKCKNRDIEQQLYQKCRGRFNLDD